MKPCSRPEDKGLAANAGQLRVLRITGHSPVVVELLDLSGLSGFFGDPLLIVRKPT